MGVAAHEYVVEAVAGTLGRRTALFGSLNDELFGKLALGIVDQLSVYCQQVPFAQLQHGNAMLREGYERAYVMAWFTDRGGPLRLKSAFDRWTMEVADDDETYILVNAINSRRWHFLDRWMHRFMVPLLSDVGDALVRYYVRKPHAVPEAGIIRLCEDVDRTWLVAEIDCRDVDAMEPGKNDTPGRYLVQ